LNKGCDGDAVDILRWHKRGSGWWKTPRT